MVIESSAYRSGTIAYHSGYLVVGMQVVKKQQPRGFLTTIVHFTAIQMAHSATAIIAQPLLFTFTVQHLQTPECRVPEAAERGLQATSGRLNVITAEEFEI